MIQYQPKPPLVLFFIFYGEGGRGGGVPRGWGSCGGYEVVRLHQSGVGLDVRYRGQHERAARLYFKSYGTHAIHYGIYYRVFLVDYGIMWLPNGPRSISRLGGVMIQLPATKA